MINLPPSEDESGEEPGVEPISRSQRKREAEEITQLGQLISELPDSDLEKIPLDERVGHAVDELRKIRSFGARKRQLHYLGKVLRKSDLEPIRAALKAIQMSAKAETQLLHVMEQWRDRLLGEGDPALSEFLQQYPRADRQQLRQIVRNHNKEVEQKKIRQASNSAPEHQKNAATKSSREIFKLIRATLTDAAEE